MNAARQSERMRHAEVPDADTLLQDASWKRSMRRRLVNWYRKSARDLPWRSTRDPYHIWLSEIMLQQTQVATVIPYFARFLDRFPSVRELALADESEVLRLWEGLGYYRRARQLHQAARRIVDQHGGEFPHTDDEVRALPGIGRYTAGAILSIAFDQPAPIVEANTIRLLSRLLAYSGDPTSGEGTSLLWRAAEALLPRKSSGEFNQALMELGSLVCTPQDPDCSRCPLRTLCPTEAHGLQAAIPRKAKRVQYEKVREAAVVIWRGDRVLVRQCEEGERWAGLWDFPRFSLEAHRGTKLASELAQKTRRITGMRPQIGTQLTTIAHGVTRYRIRLSVYEAQLDAGRAARTKDRQRWLHPNRLESVALSVTGRKIADLLQQIVQ